MSTDLLEDPELTSEDTAPQEKSSRFGLGNKKIKILILLVLVMGVEGAGLFFFLPRASSSGSGGHGDETAEETVEVDTVEVEIGSFQTTNDNAPGMSIHVSFKVTATVVLKQEMKFDQQVNLHHPALIREAIESVWRSASLADLDAPDLKAIKSKIKDSINKTLKQDYVKKIIIHDYRKNQL